MFANLHSSACGFVVNVVRMFRLVKAFALVHARSRSAREPCSELEHEWRMGVRFVKLLARTYGVDVDVDIKSSLNQLERNPFVWT